MIRAIGIDLDDTLVNENQTIRFLEKRLIDYKILKKHGFNISIKEFKNRFKEFSKTWKTIDQGQRSKPGVFYKELCNFLGFSVSSLESKKMHDKFFSIYLKKLRLYPKTKALLDWIKKKDYKLWLISNGSLQTRAYVIEFKGISHYFDGMLTSDLFGLKRDLKIFKVFLDKTNTKPKNALMIGNGLEDGFCRKVGIRFLLVRRRATRLGRITKNVDMIITSFLKASRAIKTIEKQKYRMITDYF